MMSAVVMQRQFLAVFSRHFFGDSQAGVILEVSGQGFESGQSGDVKRGAGEKVLIFTDMKSQGQFLWEAERSDDIQQRHLPAGNEGVWFLPQPVSGEFLPNPRLDGKLSRRSEEAITAWRYVP